MDKNTSPTVYSTVASIIGTLESSEKRGEKRTDILAELRRSAGKDVDEAKELWPFLFENVPRKFISESSSPSYAENAILNSLQLYALCHQGGNQIKSDTSYKGNLGDSLKGCRSEPYDKRFNVMTASADYSTLIYRLTRLIVQAKSRGNAKINFPRLASDLFRAQAYDGSQVAKRWAIHYYTPDEKEKDTEPKENK